VEIWNGTRGQAITTGSEGIRLPIKSWSCPSCRREFIVDSESARDTCPWCRTTVEEKNGTLQEVPSEQAKEPARESDSQPAAANEAKTGEKAAAGSNNAWWPFEYSS